MTTSSPKEQANANMQKAKRDIEELYKLAKPVEGKDDHNYIALRGGSITDMEFVEEFGVPKEYAKTRKLNDFMLEKVQGMNIKTYESEE